MIEAFREKAQTRKRPFIMPTPNGFILAGVIFTLFLMGLVYANNLSLLLSFSLLSFFLGVMFKTHEQFHSVEISNISLSDGAQAIVSLRAPEFIHCELHTDKEILKTKRSPSAEYLIQANRGSFKVKRAKLWTNGEWGLFHVWRYIKVNQRLHVYPTPLHSEQISLTTTPKSGSETFNKHTRYVQGLQATRIDWKVYAKNEELFVKDFEEEKWESLKIDFKNFNGEKEEKLSMMAWLVNQAHSQNSSWAITMPAGIYLESASGHEHYTRTMELLSEA